MKVFISIFLFICSLQSTAQEFENVKIYRNLKKAIRNSEKVEALSLYGKGLTEIPQEIFEMKNLRLLILANNNISIIPDQISELKSLEKFVLFKNNISELPLALTELTQLKKLYVFYNYLSDRDARNLQKFMPNCFIMCSVIL